MLESMEKALLQANLFVFMSKISLFIGLVLNSSPLQNEYYKNV